MDCWSISLPLDDEFKKLVNRMNPHRVTIDNDSSRKATPIKVASANKRGSLLEVVQVQVLLCFSLAILRFLLKGFGVSKISSQIIVSTHFSNH
ncbi:hypothetical protein IC582_001256 [Cucumis melo]